MAREEAAAAVFFTVPGPKMIWQFEERGYDVPLNYGGSNVANKPPRWEYMTVPERRHLYDTYKSIIDLRLNNPAIFNSTSFTYDFYNNGGLYKLFQIADPGNGGLKVTVVANLDVVAQSRSVTFQATGNWVNYISNGSGSGINGATGTVFSLTAATQTISLQPGEYHIYVSVPACVAAAPVANTPINYCQGSAAVPLSATGTNLLWYTTATGGTGSTTAPTPSTAAAGSTTYYVSQTIGCESPRFAIVVNVSAATLPPIVTSPVTYCRNSVAVPLTAAGTNLLWYTTATGGTGSATAPTPSTATAGSTTYYVSQTQSCGESQRAALTIVVTPTPPAPAGLSVTGITTNSAVLNWTTSPGNFYTVDFKPVTSGVWINAATSVTAGSIVISNLTPGTVYDWRVSVNCSNIPVSNYTSAQFTVNNYNSQITNIKNGFGIKISPNPVNENASVDYIVPGSGEVNMTIFNAYGQRMKTIFSSVQVAGQYRLSVAGQFMALPGGCYFLRLEQNGKGYFVRFIKK